MKLSEQNILIISPESWDHIWVSKHHYARTLAEMGATVVFTGPPKKAWNLSQTEYDNLRTLNYPKFIKGLRKLPSVISRWLIKRKLTQIEAYCELKFDVVWSFDNSVFFDFSFLNSSFNISHIVDLNQDFETKKASKTATICLGNTKQLILRQQIDNPKTHFINHGLNHPLEEVELDMPQSDNIKVGYFGNLDIPYLDWANLQKAFGELNNLTFYFAGACKSNLDKIDFDNINYLGVLHSNQLTTFCKEMDLLILCYLSDEYPDQLANPHKFMEYLASGKPIVSSYTDTYSNVKEVQMASSQSEWLPLLKSTVSELDHWNTSDMTRARKTLALSNTYEKQILKIEKLINDQLLNK